MVQMAASAAREEFAEVLNRVAYGKERIVLHRHGKPLVAIIPVEDLQLLQRLIEAEEDRIEVAEARRVLANPTDEGVPLEQVKRD